MFKDYAKLVLGSVAAIALITGIGFATGEAQALYNRTVGSDISSSQTDMWHKSKGFTDGMAQDLSRYKLELAQTKDEVARAAIIDHINEEFANFDENQIKNEDLRQFLKNVRNGDVQ
jgi:hypothetical protein